MNPDLKDVMVHLDGGGGDQARLDHADSLCTAYGAHLTAVYANAEPMPIATGYGGIGSGQVYADVRDQAIRAGDRIEEKLREDLKAIAAPWDFRRYDAFPAEAAEALCADARVADLVVMTRPYNTDEGAPDMAEAVIFGAGRGVLMLPPGTSDTKATPETVLIAWSNTREAARAVAEAMPFLAKARSVVVATAGEGSMPGRPDAEPGADIARYLDRHGIRVELRQIEGTGHVGESLLSEAASSGAGMIVMGSYGHSRLRQIVLGGVTRTILSDATIPVLTAH